MVVNLNFQDLTAETAWDAVPGTGDGADLALGMEQAEGSAFADVLVGSTKASDRLWGLAGKDQLSSYGGADRLFGGGGVDFLSGGGGRDRLAGGTGIDHVNGGGGVDVCSRKPDIRTSCEK
jgi:Ca2+-binding RTX toxin-like protein